jgi:hypothetical protein
VTTFGTHNTLDGAAPATPFADVLLFTEAIPERVRAALEPLGYVVAPCRQQRDLVIAWKRGTFTPRRKRYRLAHPGIAKVTPHRGTYWIVGRLNGKRAVLLVEHRINAAFPPYRRGEATFRRLSWSWHTRLTLRQIRRFRRQGLLVVCGGDLNTSHGVSGYRGELHEAGAHFDRLGSTQPIRAVELLSRMGSDHPRLKAEIRG